MLTRQKTFALPPGLWIVGAVLGLAAGAAVVVPTGYLIAGVATVATAAAFFRATVRSELIVAAYWIALCVFSTMLTGAVIGGMFYPFYVALILGVVLGLLSGGLQVHPFVGWTYVAFLVVLVLSLVGYQESLGSATLERLIVYPFGALVLLQFRSVRGVRTVALAAVAAALAVSAWVIVSAVQGGFAYRGSIEVNENVVSFYVALGLVVALAERLHLSDDRRLIGSTLLTILAMGTMTYALVLLASRGMIIGLALAVVALGVRVAIVDRRRLGFLALVLVVASTGLLLPGGQGILERFENPSTATGGGRIQIWGTIGRGLATGSAGEMLLGHGFEASRDLVSRTFSSLDSTHNAYLQIVYDLGSLGLVLFIALHGFVFARSWRTPGRDGAAMLGLVTFLLGSSLFMSTPDNFLYWTALGLALALATWSVPHDSGVRAAS